MSEQEETQGAELAAGIVEILERAMVGSRSLKGPHLVTEEILALVYGQDDLAPWEQRLLDEPQCMGDHRALAEAAAGLGKIRLAMEAAASDELFVAWLASVGDGLIVTAESCNCVTAESCNCHDHPAIGIYSCRSCSGKGTHEIAPGDHQTCGMCMGTGEGQCGKPSVAFRSPMRLRPRR